METSISIGIDSEHEAGVFIDRKSYALLNPDGSVLVKGASLRSRSIEKIFRELVYDIVVTLLTADDMSIITKMYNDTKERINNRELVADDLCTRASLKKSVEQYINDVESNRCNRSTAYELAMKYSDHNLDQGDVVKFYYKQPPMEIVTVRGKEVERLARLKNFEIGELADNFNNDYYIQHYLKRLDTIVKRFYGFENFHDMFPEVKLTPKEEKERFNYDQI